MAGTSSFDIVSKFDRQELKNAVDQAQREMHTRYDLKDTKSEITLDEKAVTITAPSDYVLTTIRDMLESKAIRRNLSLKIFDPGKIEEISGGRVRQVIALKEGLADDLAKKMAKTIRDEFKKVQPQIQGDAIRVQAKNKDDLQTVIQYFRQHEEDYPVALQFVNYR
jgi:cyclic-di-GMP-binding protein